MKEVMLTIFVISVVVLLIALNGLNLGAESERAKWTCTKRIVSSGVCVEQVRKGSE